MLQLLHGQPTASFFEKSCCSLDKTPDCRIWRRRQGQDDGTPDDVTEKEERGVGASPDCVARERRVFVAGVARIRVAGASPACATGGRRITHPSLGDPRPCCNVSTPLRWKKPATSPDIGSLKVASATIDTSSVAELHSQTPRL